MAPPSIPRPLSWRDPDGFVVNVNGRIFRAVALEKAAQCRELLSAEWMAQLIGDGHVPRTIETSRPPELDGYGDDYIWLEHAVLPFPCYPHEITAAQLYDSGVLTLRIAIEAARHGWVLKDASAWNVLHSHGRPIFVDFLSFERRGGSTTWMAYGQFGRHFLLPLLLFRKLGLTPPEIFSANRDGISPERVFQMLGASRLLSAVSMELVLLPRWLSRAGGRLIADQSSRRPPVVKGALAQELVLSTLRRLQKLLGRLQPRKSGHESLWENYEEGRGHYSNVDLAAKRDFVREHLKDSRTVLDLGCNAGEFSLIAAEGGREVVAADADHGAVSRFYERIRGQQTLITPTMLNIGQPTPAMGWENREIASFLDRSAGRFDCVLALGLIHHLLVSERATLPLLASFFSRLAVRSLIVEWVGPDDPKFAQLAGFSAALYSQLDTAGFEACFGQEFTLAAKIPLPCRTRVMYLWSR